MNDGILGRLRADERGVSAIIVALSMTAVLGAGMLSIDAGSAWRGRRTVITYTDAAALAAARYLDAHGAAGCTDALVSRTASAAGREANYLLQQNDPATKFTNLVASPHGGNCAAGSGHVRVDATLPYTTTFAGIFGAKDSYAFSSSTAQYGPLVGMSGLRPIGICDKDPHFLEWTQHLAGNDTTWGQPAGTHPNYGPGVVVHRIAFQRGGTACGSQDGDWGWLDYNDNKTPNGDTALRDWLLNGYGGTITLGDPTLGIAADCDPELAGNQGSCTPKPGAGGGSFSDSLVALRDNGTVFPILVYDSVIDQRDPLGCSTPPANWSGAGSNARYCPVAFLLVRLYGWSNITGQLGDNSYFDLQFVDAWWVGSVVGVNPSGGRPTTHGVQLCGGNYGTTIDSRCDT